jgi:AcrR family transcriptional regulator
MRTSWRHLLTALLVLAAGLTAFIPGPARATGEAGDDTEAPRKQALPWHDNPEQYRRLKEEWKAFHKLPPDRQERLRQFDEQLNEEPPAVRARLWAVLDRYTTWLKGLDEKDRQQIESAPDADHKLEVIRGLREREWVSHLARAERERIERAPPEERAKLIETIRQQERKRQDEWQAAVLVANETPPPQLQGNLWPRIRLYEQKSLVPTLTHTERDELAKAARSSWPEHAQALLDLSAKHPILLPPSEHLGVVSFADPLLPKGYAQQFAGKGGRPREGEARRLRELQGRWPNFALELDKAARARRVALPDRPLGPCRPEDFVKEVQTFVKDLRKDAAAAKKLDETAGKWPDYPLAVMELAKERKKTVPGTVLPGQKELAEQAKATQGE